MPGAPRITPGSNVEPGRKIADAWAWTFDGIIKPADLSSTRSAVAISNWHTGTTSQDTTYEYDFLGRLKKVTNPDGTVTSQTYTINEHMTTYTDAMSHRKTVRTDAYGDIIQVDEPSGSATYTTTYTYDTTRGQLIEIKDAMNYPWSNTWDSLGRKLAMSDPDLGSWTFTYTPAGRLSSQTDAKMQTITFLYDVLGRVTTETYVAKAAPNVVNWMYDQPSHGQCYGRGPTSISDLSGSETITYDWAGRAASRTKWIGAESATMQWTWDTVQRLKTVTYPSPAETVTYTYSPDGVSAVSGLVTTVTYSAQWQPVQRVDVNGAVSTYTYDKTKRMNPLLTKISVKKGSSTLFEETYTYNDDTLVTMAAGVGTWAPQYTYTYDDLHQLTTATTVTTLPTTTTTQTFTYDGIHRMTGNSDSGTYTYNNNVPIHAPKSVAGVSYQYDLNGNLTGRGSARTIAWTRDNRPESITDGSSTSTYAYDSSGLRVKKVSPTETTYYFSDLLEKSNGSWVKYYALGGGIIGRKDSTNASCLQVKKVAPNKMMYNISDLLEKSNESWIKYDVFSGGIIGKKDSMGTYWYHRDHLSTVRAISNSAGTWKNAYYYQAYGKTAGSKSTRTDDLSFALHRDDKESGYIYMKYRTYDPVLCHFLSADLVEPDLTRPATLNRYTYVINDPINLIDPLGLYGVYNTDPKPPKYSEECEKKFKCNDGSKHVVNYPCYFGPPENPCWPPSAFPDEPPIWDPDSFKKWKDYELFKDIH